MGGLFTGALLARNGLKVTVLEQNNIVGGGLQTFRRHGRTFDAGMHIIGGMQPGGNVARICRYLGIYQDLKAVHEPIIDTIHYVADGLSLSLPRGKDKFCDYLCGMFAASADDIKRYLDRIYALGDEVGLFHLRESEDHMQMHSDEFFMPASDFIARYISEPVLQDVMAFVSPMYGGIRGVTPAYIHAIITILYIEGQGKFVGGAQQLTDALCSVIKRAGGTIITGCKVTDFKMENGRVASVSDATANSYSADVYISSVHPQALMKMVPEGTFKRAFVNRIMSLPNTYSAFQGFFIMKPGTFPYLPGANFLIESHKDTWNISQPSGNWPEGLMYITPAGVPDTVVVNAVMSFDEVRRWQDSSLLNRPDEYKAWKKSKLDAMVRRMETVHPGFAENIAYAEASSPLTIRDYFGVPQGSLYGFSRDAANIIASQLQTFTRVPNLLLTGQCINLHGLCGVPLTAVMTAEAILGRNSIIKAINENDNN